MAQVKDHHQKVKDQDHQRAKFQDQMKRIKVKILDHKIKIPFLLEGKIIKMENSICTLQIPPNGKTQTRTANPFRQPTADTDPTRGVTPIPRRIVSGRDLGRARSRSR